MMRYLILILVLLVIGRPVIAQDEEKKVVASFFNEALTDRTAYENLRYLCSTTKGRVTGSPMAAAAVEYTFQVMFGMNLDTVFRQPVKVSCWVRGEKEMAKIHSGTAGTFDISVASLGMATGTGPDGLSARVVEVKNFDELTRIGRAGIEGKIVFFNRPMDPALLNNFAAYGQAADQRTSGASKAASLGAAGVIVRSLTTSLDDFPHTGGVRYTEGIKKIPAVAVSTKGANLLSTLLKADSDLFLWYRTTCETRADVESANVIGEIRGSVYPEQIITVGGHLDAWDTGEGAHDDGAGCIQSIEVLRLFKKLGIQPKRTIRAVMFMDEEIAQRGGIEYAKQADLKKEKHYFALESDRGGLLPLGFGISAPPERLKKLLELKKYLEPYGITRFTEGGGGADIGPLGKSGTVLSSLVPDDNRYFDYHHSPNDTFDKVNIREMQLGSAAIASLIYLVDKLDR